MAPDNWSLTSTGGKAASGKFVLSAAGGPVGDYAIKVPAGVSGKMTVTPATGSLAEGRLGNGDRHRDQQDRA